MTAREKVADAIETAAVQDIGQRYYDAFTTPCRIDQVSGDETERLAEVAIFAHSAYLWERFETEFRQGDRVDRLYEDFLTALIGPKPGESR